MVRLRSSFFRRLILSNGEESRKIVTDKLRSYGVARREVIPEAIHVNDRYTNKRVEQSHEPTRMRERVMRKFKSARQAQRFLGIHATVYNLFNLVDTWYQQTITGISGQVRLIIGPWLLPDSASWVFGTQRS